MFTMTTANLVNLLFIAAGIGICSLCFFQITASKHLRKEVRNYFQIFFAMILIYITTHLARQLMDGTPGNGIRNALFMMASKIIIANNTMAGKSPAQVLSDTNNAICSNNREDMFVTVWLGILELSTGKLVAALNRDPDANIESLLKNVRASVDSFVNEAEQFDDLTMLCVEYKGKR